MSYTGLKPSLEGLAYESSTDNASGSAVTLTAPTTLKVRLTNASLVSITNIPAPTRDGDKLILQNDTSVNITIINDSGGTAANRIITGLGANATLKDEASVLLEYSTAASRWRIIGNI